jgi:hypothetical protein
MAHKALSVLVMVMKAESTGKREADAPEANIQQLVNMP